MKAGYASHTLAPVALAASTAKSILGVLTPATFGLDLQKLHIGIDSVTAANQPVQVDLLAFSADGTGTAGDVVQVYGRSITAGFSSKYAYTVEPTGPTLIDHWSITPVGGTALYDLPPNSTYDIGVSTLLAVRLTPGASLTAGNAHATLVYERC